MGLIVVAALPHAYTLVGLNAYTLVAWWAGGPERKYPGGLVGPWA